MSFNAAIFYDIENLLKGYSFSQQTITNLSLKEILDSIKQTGKVGEIAIQRAYANWSDPRLGFMRGEINELGIEPIQVFGFSQNQKKNAADIQLVVDAIDLAYVRPAIEVFVIVSGDGGFSALAKKLHEYGRTVIGCGYRNSTNRVFQAVCDEFVWIVDPEEEERQERTIAHVEGSPEPLLTHPLVIRLSQSIPKLTTSRDEDILQKTKEVLDWLEKDTEAHEELMEGGIYLSVIREAFKYAIPDFHPMRLGLLKFVEFLQFACHGTPLCVVRLPPSEVLLALRNAIPKDVEVLPDLEKRDIHSVETYRAILEAPSGTVFRLPSQAALFETAAWIAQRPLVKDQLGYGIELATTGLYPRVNAEAVRLAFLSFITAGVFEREPANAPLSEQKLTLKKELREPSLILAALRNSLRGKLESYLSEVNEDTLFQLIPQREVQTKRHKGNRGRSGKAKQQKKV